MEAEELANLVRRLKVLADESRLKILGVLADDEWSVRDLAELLSLTEPTVSHHLARLQEVDLVTMRAVGTSHRYRLNVAALRALHQTLPSVERLAALGTGVDGDAWERKVLQTFLAGERLTKIPDNRKKRLVILRWLAAQFAADRDYPEREVNALIARHHPDTATLRRELIMNQLMTRAGGVYRRLPENAAGASPAAEDEI
jgi:DNA-binding transcriptional ArsR family regulator